MISKSTARGKGSQAEQMGITEEEFDQRKKFLGFGKADEERLAALQTQAEEYSEPAISAFYDNLLAFEHTRKFFRDQRVLDRVRKLQKEYFLELTQGEYGKDYLDSRLRIGSVHERIELAPKWYMGAYSFYLNTVARMLRETFKEDPARAQDAVESLMKLMFLDMGLAIDTYIFQRERTIRQQAAAIHELSTPVLQVREHLLILPIIGIIDTHRARQLTDGLLHSIRSTRAKVVVMDITGVAAVDSKVANHLVQTIAASKLMGATVLLTGISPEVAQTLVTIGVDLTSLNTAGDLQGGLEEAERILGYRVVAVEEDRARPGKTPPSREE